MFFVSCLLVRELRRRDGHFFEKDDFNAVYFPLGWDFRVDSHGQGIKVFYPMRVKTFISWSPKKYEMGMGGIPALLPRAYQENISFNFIKVALAK